MKSRKFAVSFLLLASPLIGEYLLGSLPASMIAVLPLMIAMYGAGALLIREIVRSTGGGWTSMVLLACAYGLFEEGFVTQSLFNPDYLHLRLLDFGFLPAIGTALPWAIFVVSIHIVWSITVPIALTESAFPVNRDRPWLGTFGRVSFALVFAAGCTAIAAFSHKQSPFMATPGQFAATGALILALCVTAIRLPKPKRMPAKVAPCKVTIFLASFLSGSVFMLAARKADGAWHLSWPTVVALTLGIEALFVAFIVFHTRAGQWDEPRRFALPAGAFLVYAWIGFQTDIALHGTSDLVGHSIIAAAMCAALLIVGVRVNRRSAQSHPVARTGDQST